MWSLSSPLNTPHSFSPSPSFSHIIQALLRNNPSASKKFVIGNTSIGVYKNQNPDMWIYYNNVPEYHSLSLSSGKTQPSPPQTQPLTSVPHQNFMTGTLIIGAAVSISSLLDFLQSEVKNNSNKLAIQVP